MFRGPRASGWYQGSLVSYPTISEPSVIASRRWKQLPPPLVVSHRQTRYRGDEQVAKTNPQATYPVVGDEMPDQSAVPLIGIAVEIDVLHQEMLEGRK